MSVIPCKANAELRAKARKWAEDLKTQAHTIGDHGLSETEFYDSGLFRSAIETLRGQFSASMSEKRTFVSRVLDFLAAHGDIRTWDSAGGANRHDYTVELNSGRLAAIELKGCLDGNNTNIFDRPPHVHEFIVWSVCTNPGADPRHNAWSGLHVRLGAEMISRGQQIDGVIIWDMLCGTIGRPCPKLDAERSRETAVGPHGLPPPCIYLFPPTIPAPRNNPRPASQSINDVEILKAFHERFAGKDAELNYVEFEVAHEGRETVRSTHVIRGGGTARESEKVPLKRS